MKRIGIIITLLCTLGVLLGFFILNQKNVVRKSNNEDIAPCDAISATTYRVAILLPVSHPALEEIQQGFIDELSKQVAISYDIYNGNGDRILMRSQADQTIQKNYDLVCAITTPVSLICKEVFSQRKSSIPVVCCAVSENPVEIGLVESLEHSGNNVVVVSDHYDFDQQLNVLLRLHPTKTLIVPYYPSPGLEKQTEQLRIVCEKFGIALITTKIYATHELFTRVDALLSAHNNDAVIMVLKDNLVVSGIEALVALARRKHTPLYVSDLNSVDKGAVLGFGVFEYEIGVAAAQKAIYILRDHKQPSEIPSNFIHDFRVKINISEMSAQRFILDQTVLFLLKSTLFAGEQ